MDKLIAEILDEIIIEAENGITYNNATIRFHTLEGFSLNSCYNDTVPILVIKNKKELINRLKQYIELVIAVKKLDTNKNDIKKAIISLFSNACYEDFSKPCKFISNHISFYLNDDFMKNDKLMDNIVIKKITEPLSKELPYAFKAYIKDKDKKYYLPNISYGISDDTCYIYGLNQVTINKDKDFASKIEETYDIETTTLSLFFQELYNYGISKVKIVSCLPMIDNMQDALNELLDRITKLSYLFNNISIISNPFEKDEYMNIEVEEFIRDSLLVDNNYKQRAI